MLVAFMTTSGVWAQTEMLLTTIESKTYQNSRVGSFITTDGKAKVTFNSFVFNSGTEWGWFSSAERELTVSAGEGYTITMCKFYTKDTPEGYPISTAPFKVYLKGQYVYTGVNGTGVNLGQFGVTKIETFGGDSIVVTADATNTWLFTMPASDAKIFVEYYPAAVASTVPVAVSGIHADDDIDLVSEGITSEGTMMYARTINTTAPSFDSFSEVLPTAEGLTEAGTVYVWYYIKSDTVHSDSEIFGPIEVSIDTPLPTHDLSFNSSNDHKIEDGKALVKIDRRFRTGDINNGIIAQVKLGQTVIITPNTGYKFLSVNDIVLANDGSASFQMPDNEMTVDYNLVREMEYRVSAKMSIDRIRIQKNGENQFEPVNEAELLPIVVDTIVTIPRNMILDTDYEVILQQQVGDNWSDTQNYSVGIFRLKIIGKGLYDGVTYTPAFELYQGYEVFVPSQSYVTYYKEEPLYVEDTDAKLYIIKEVGEESVTITELNVVPSNTPLLVYNNSNKGKLILLIPTTDEEANSELVVADEFKGTLDDKQMEASSDDVNYYVLQSNAFVWVNTSGTISAHRCWLAISNQTLGARRLSIVVDGSTTGVNWVERDELNAEDWYDLNGRKLNGIPTRKGVYIMRSAKDRILGRNGMKAIIK